MARPGVLAALLACCTISCDGYSTGDPVQMSKRIQVNGVTRSLLPLAPQLTAVGLQKVTAWHDVHLSNSPEFGEPKSWVVPGLVERLKKTHDGTSPIKL